MDREKCQSCGNPVWLCHSADNRIQFEIKTGACYAKAEIEDYEKGDAAPKLGSGEYRYAVPVGVENEDGSNERLPSRREALAKIG